MEVKKTSIIIDGLDGTGKSTLAKKLKEKHPDLNIKERGILTPATLLHWEEWDRSKPIGADYYILVEAEIEEARKRILNREKLTGLKPDKYETEEALFLFRARYRQLASFYGGVHLMDSTHLTPDEMLSVAEDIIFNNNKSYVIPSIDNISDEEFNKLPLIIEGESKIIRKLSERFNLIKYKPTVYSHKMQRAGIVEKSDIERLLMSKNIIDLLIRNKIKHCYWYIGDKFILSEALNEKDIPPVEVIVKKCFIGSDKHRYYNLEKLKNRFNEELVKQNEYNKLIVRFDYRNPNFHPETKQPLGDFVLCDDLADEMINVQIAKKTALNVFNCIDEHFKKMNIDLEDICLMITTNGENIYGEISQDCGRYKHMEENKLTDLDKDVWRAGGSSELVLSKYQMLTSIVKKYVYTVYDMMEKKHYA